MLFSALVISCFVQVNHVNAQGHKAIGKKNFTVDQTVDNETGYTIKIERDFKSHNATIYLLTDKIKTDSLLLYNLDFKTDSLISYNNTWWHYYFSTCVNCIPTVVCNIHQFVFTADNKRLQLAFVNQHKKITKYMRASDIPHVSDSNAFFSMLRKQYHSFSKITLGNNFFKGDYKVEEIFYCATCNYLESEQKGFIKTYKLQFDKAQKVFYTKRVKMNGEYEFEQAYNGETIKRNIKGEEFLLLRFYNSFFSSSSFAYYKGKWYYYFAGSNTDKNGVFMPLDIIYSLCKNGCE
jgi:hypothetical protein